MRTLITVVAPEDITTLTAQLHTALDSHYADVLPQNPAPKHHIGLAYHDPLTNTVIAGLIAQQRFAWMHLSLLWVDPAHQRKRYGTALLEALETFARTHDLLGLTVTTLDYQAPEFYQKAGFVRDGTLFDHPTNSHRHFFHKALTNHTPPVPTTGAPAWVS